MTTSEYGGGVTFEILEHIGVIATFPTGWKKEINFVSWNGAAGKYDIREWDPSHTRMSRGMTFKENEMRLLLDIMRRRHGGGYRGVPRNAGPAVSEAVAPVVAQAAQPEAVAQPENTTQFEPAVITTTEPASEEQFDVPDKTDESVPDEIDLDGIVTSDGEIITEDIE